MAQVLDAGESAAFDVLHADAIDVVAVSGFGCPVLETVDRFELTAILAEIGIVVMREHLTADFAERQAPSV